MNDEVTLNEYGLISQDGNTEARFDPAEGIVFE